MQRKINSTKKMALTAVLGAIAAILMLFEIPLIFIAPSFYGLDFSEIPILIGTFILGPLSGFAMECIKILIKLILKPTTTGFVGEFANLIISLSLVLPAGFFYKKFRSKKGALLGLITGSILMVIVGTLVNVYVMIPFYSKLMPLEAIISAGAEINHHISNIWTFALICVAPFNFIKAVLVSIFTFFVYKRIHNVIKKIIN